MKTRLTLILLAALFAALSAKAQSSIHVASFRLLDTDLSANLQGSKRIDQNGHTAALIKVVTTQTGFTFDVGVMGITDTEQKAGEIWVWVPFGVKHINIGHPTLGFLRDYHFPCSIEEARTYEMVLTTGTVETIVKETVRQQYLVFQVSPPDATLEVNDQIWPISAEGTAKKYVNFDKYDYRVQALNYHSEVGKVTVSDPENACVVKVNLKPNFGWIEVSGTELQGANVYIDNVFVGKAPYKSDALKSGQHSVKIAKELYETYTQTVTVADNETAKVSPTLTADFANVTLAVDADAEIWVNDEKKGIRSWTGNLSTGTYKIECKMANHETTLTTREISNDMNGQVISLNAPRPIYGSLNVDATPDFCDLYIDGKKVGQTPKFIPELLVGQHQVKLTKANYADYTETVTIAKGETKTVNATLSNTATVRFTCNAANATLYVDGTALGSASGSYALGYGSHSLRATAEGYDDFTGTIEVSDSRRSFEIAMRSKEAQPLTFTVNGITFKMLPVEGGTFTMGATAEQGSDADSDERPTHNVTLSSFYMGETEVTQELWQAVMGSNPSYFGGSNLPVEYVSWNDCQTFINKLNQQCASQLNGKQFSLPTEAQWEYAARGGNKSKGYKYSGSNTLGNVAWYYDNSGSTTHAVGTKQANELGLYDMSGNVWEWCSDWYGSYGSGAQTNPTGSTSGSDRVGRGGGWSGDARYCRVSSRISGTPGGRGRDLGLRLSFR